MLRDAASSFIASRAFSQLPGCQRLSGIGSPLRCVRIQHQMVRNLLAILSIAAAAALPALAADCDTLSGLKLADTTITAAKPVAAGAFTSPAGPGRATANPFAALPAFCQVHGII